MEYVTVCPWTVPQKICPRDSSSLNQFIPETVYPRGQTILGTNWFGDKPSWYLSYEFVSVVVPQLYNSILYYRVFHVKT